MPKTSIEDIDEEIITSWQTGNIKPSNVKIEYLDID